MQCQKFIPLSRTRTHIAPHMQAETEHPQTVSSQSRSIKTRLIFIAVASLHFLVLLSIRCSQADAIY